MDVAGLHMRRLTVSFCVPVRRGFLGFARPSALAPLRASPAPPKHPSPAPLRSFDGWSPAEVRLATRVFGLFFPVLSDEA
jgi:hypothetical protein